MVFRLLAVSQSIRLPFVRGVARLRAVKPFRSPDRLFWFGTFRSQVRREADLFISSHGALAYRYARDHVRLAEMRRRKRDVALYSAVTEEIGARSTPARPIACTATAMWLPDWLPALNGAIASLA
jgi:hypothetical protein